MSFFSGTQTEVLYALAAPVTKNTYTTIAAYTGVAGTNPICSIPPGWALNDNPNPISRGLYLHAEGTIANTAAATFANAININPTVATSTSNITINAFATSTMTIQCNGRIVYESVATGGAPTTTSQASGFSGTWTGLDPRVQQYVELFGTWNASAAGNTTTVQQLFLFGLN